MLIMTINAANATTSQTTKAVSHDCFLARWPTYWTVTASDE
jgi:hypothetical protein